MNYVIARALARRRPGGSAVSSRTGCRGAISSIQGDCSPARAGGAMTSGEIMATAPKAQLLHMADLASYQEGSVVSRQITKEDAGNITLFAFDQGQELSEHTAPFDAFAH